MKPRSAAHLAATRLPAAHFPTWRLSATCLLAALLAGCAARPLAACSQAVSAPLSVQVVDHGWHTDLALPADGLAGPLARFRQVFPGLRVLLVGFGRRSFMTSPARGVGDYLIGPFPGDAVLLVAGLAAAPAQAYGDGGTVATIPLTPAARDRLDRFVWDTFAHDAQGQVEPIGPAFFRGGVFYAARPGYSGANTCNTWTVAALAAAGLDVSAFGVVFAGQAMGQAGRLGAVCRF